MNFSRTLIIKPSSMGDVVQALPVLTALKEQHGGTRVWWLVAEPLVELLEGHPRLAGLVPFDRHRLARAGRSFRATEALAAFLHNLRRQRFTAVLDLQGLFRSGAMALATGAPSRVGFHSARELAPLFYTREVSLRNPEMHAVDRYLELARAAGLDVPPKGSDHLPVSAEARGRVRARLEAEGLAAGAPFLAVCPWARWMTKRWPPERYGRVAADAARDLGARSVLVGTAEASEAAREIAEAAARAGSDAPPIDLTGRTSLKELVAVIAEARALVTNDSGPMHIAAAVGTPTVALFGPTNPRRTGPFGPGHRVIAGRAACSPCYRRQCLLGGTETIRCLKNVTAEEVSELVADRWRTA